MPAEIKIYSLKEVEEHKHDKDVWIVIHDRVYDVTKFLDEVRTSGACCSLRRLSCSVCLVQSVTK